MRTALFASLLLAATLWATQAAAWTPTSQALAALAKGQPWAEVTTDTDGVGLIHAVIDIAAPRQVVWRVMTDCASTHLLMANTQCRIVQGDIRQGSDIREQTTSGNFLFPGMRYTYRSEYLASSLIRFRRQGGDIKTLEGEWRLESLNGGGTRVIYVNRVAVSVMAPAPVVRAGLRRDIPKMLLNLRRESLAAARAG